MGEREADRRAVRIRVEEGGRGGGMGLGTGRGGDGRLEDWEREKEGLERWPVKVET